MKRKIVALILALTFCLSLSATAFAGTVRESGQTNGETSQIGTYAELYVDRNRCEATTDADVETDLTFTTSVIYYYIDELGMEQATSDSGSTSAGAGTLNYNSGDRATSYHRVRGDSSLGSWGCSLEEYA